MNEESDPTRQNAPEAILAVDADWAITAANDAAARLLDRPASDVVGAPIWTAYPALEGTPFEAALRTAMSGSEVVSRDGHLPSQDAWLELRAVPADDGLSAFIRDVTEQRSRRRELETTVGALRTLYDVTTDHGMAFEEKVDRTLEMGCERLGLPFGFLSRIEGADGAGGEQIIVQSYGDHPLLQPTKSCPLSEAYCRRTIETDGLLAIQDAIAAGMEDDPAYETFELGSYIGGKVLVEGELYGTLCFAGPDSREAPFTGSDRMLVRVMSKWTSYELERRRKTEELGRTNERLDQFAGAVSHDLRNPLTVAKGRLELARDGFDDEYGDLEATAGALDRMETLIEEALLLAREGEAATDVAPVDLQAVATAAFRNVETADASVEVEATGAVVADRDRLTRLLENLVRNAIDHAGTEVTITIGDLPDGIYVADDGPGIPEDERETVFERGYTTSNYGTGFGLAIVREIATGHGWAVEVTESEDGGARFEVTGVERP